MLNKKTLFFNGLYVNYMPQAIVYESYSYESSIIANVWYELPHVFQINDIKYKLLILPHGNSFSLLFYEKIHRTHKIITFPCRLISENLQKLHTLLSLFTNMPRLSLCSVEHS